MRFRVMFELFSEYFQEAFSEYEKKLKNLVYNKKETK